MKMLVSVPFLKILTIFFVFAVTLNSLSCGVETVNSRQILPPVTILGAKLIDSMGDELITDSVIVIRGTRIESVGYRSHTPVPKGGEIVDGRGLVVAPLTTGKSEHDVIKAGNVADLVLFKDNSTADIGNNRQIEHMMQAGEWVH